MHAYMSMIVTLSYVFIFGVIACIDCKEELNYSCDCCDCAGCCQEK
jgi:hypothetical protein